MAKLTKTSVGRRGFLKGAAAGAAATFASTQTSSVLGQQQQGAGGRGGRGGAPQPGGAAIAREDGTAQPQPVSYVVENPGSDYMVEVIKSLGIEYVAFNPGSSFEGLHESLINAGSPEIITCTHEENAVAMAHGYAKVEGKPMMALLHGTIGVQHAAMAIYNAYGDRVPIFMVTGYGDTAVPAHTAIDLGAMVRDYVKWDHQPLTLQDTANAFQRAYKLAMMPPMAPTMVTVAADLQMDAMPANRPRVPAFTMPSIPSADLASVRQIAKDLVNAANPRIQAGSAARTQEGIEWIVELAELLGMPCNTGGNRVNFPSRHPLGGNGEGPFDVVLSLEAGGGGGGGGRGGAAGQTKSIVISTADLLATQNYNIGWNGVNGDTYVAADAQATLPALIEEVKRLITPDMRRRFDDRARKHAAVNNKARADAVLAAQYGWDASPISLARIQAELWPLIKNDDWSFVSPAGFTGGWAQRLWDMKKTYHYLGGQGAGGMGYGAPAAVGAALANKKHGRISINIQTDGDMNYSPGCLWTAAHHRLPLLSIMHNNRGYHQEVMFIARAAAIRNRGADKADVGTRLIDPNIDYKKMAEAYGMYSEGPISDPKDLVPALKRGLERVRKGEPVMIDVITQPRS